MLWLYFIVAFHVVVLLSRMFFSCPLLLRDGEIKVASVQMDSATKAKKGGCPAPVISLAKCWKGVRLPEVVLG